MGRLDSKSRFAFPGSIPHFPPILPFVIDHMTLKIEPDLDSKRLENCEVEFQIRAIRDTFEIELDAVELEIKEIRSSPINIKDYNQQEKADKLVITFIERLKKGQVTSLNIRYSSGKYDSSNFGQGPRSGFHFIKPDTYYPNKATQAWTQGETIESRYWFPCVDHPFLKYTREIHIVVPSEYDVISNGITDNFYKEKTNPNTYTNKTKWIWKELNPNPTYLTSIVIGKFSKKSLTCDNDRKTSLYYYWSPEVREEDAMLTFEDTPKMLKFFEVYLGINYPYQKYSQVAVEDFEFGGMENTTCTTLNSSILHDKKAHIDYSSDYLIAHELAHQWFGDLVTCKDWEHIWLNEGFANYCEALYWEDKYKMDNKKNEFHYYVMQAADSYFDEANSLYKRPIVTRTYKHPDEMFDAHSYEKGGCVLHMLRNYVGDEKFRESICKYLNKFGHSTADTNDLREVFEDVQGQSLGFFFEQWLYRSGHPKLEIEFSIDEYNKQGKIKVIQIQDEDPFEFDLEAKITYCDDKLNDLDSNKKTIKISKKENEITFDLHTDQEGKIKPLKFISFDPDFKVLKEINSMKVSTELLLRLIEDKNTNAIERIQGIRTLKDKYSIPVISVLKKTILEGEFYGVAVEAANVIGGFQDDNDFIKTNNAFMVIKECLETSGKKLHPKIQRALIKNIAVFEKEESLDLILSFISQAESYFVQSEAATALGKVVKNIKDENKRKFIVERLMILSNDNFTFRNVLAQGALKGLREFAKDDNETIASKIQDRLMEMSKYGSDYFKRLAAVPALSKVLRTKDEKKKNNRVFQHLTKTLIRDPRVRIRSLVCQVLAGPDALDVSKPDSLITESMEILSSVASHDIDGSVRREAETSLNEIKQWINEWSQQPIEIPLELRKKIVKKEQKVLETRIERLLRME